MAGSSRMKLRDGDRLIDAEFSVQLTGPQTFEVVLESGGGPTGGRTPRNSEYREALAELLRRATAVASTLDDCVVVSRPTRHLPEAERRVHPSKNYAYPIRLSASEDFESLRLALTTPQGDIASKAVSGGGNERKRIALKFTARNPELSMTDVMAALDTLPSDTPRRDRKDIAVGLSNEDIEAAREEWREAGADAFHAKYGTRRAAKFVIADPDGTEYDAKAILFAARTIAGLDGENSDFDGDAGTVAEPLIERGYVVEDISARDPDDSDHERLSEAARQRAIQQAKAFAGHTDATIERRVRREQRLLRKALGLGNGSHTCAFCGRTYPDRLLVAAHIKRRSECTQEERVDIPAIAMIACALGCDALFELGYVVVNPDGVIEATDRADSGEHVRELAANLHGRILHGYDDQSAPYFAWHREQVRGSLSGGPRT